MLNRIKQLYQIGVFSKFKQYEREYHLRFWAILATVYLLFAGTFSYLAPGGTWYNTVLGVPLWLESDPAGPYLVSSHHFFESSYTLFVGHPGITLHLFLFLIMKGAFWFHQLIGGDLSFTLFTILNLKNTYFLCKLGITILHIVSFYLLYRFSRTILDSERAAILSALGYATSFPVLYYLSRISVEPFLVIFFLLAFLAIWKYQASFHQKMYLRGICYIIISAVSAVAGFYTKMHLLGVFPLFMLVYIFFGKRLKNNSAVIILRLRMLASAVYICTALPMLYLGQLKMDWERFISFWFRHTPGTPGFNQNISPFDNVIQNLEAMIKGYITEIYVFLSEHIFDYISTLSKNGIFTMSEWAFLGLSIIGIFLLRRKFRQMEACLLWPALYAALTFLIFIHRHDWHYLFIILPFISVFFGHSVSRLLEVVHIEHLDNWPTGKVVLSVILVHFVAIWMVFASRCHDVYEYRKNVQPFYRALDLISPEDRIAVISHYPPETIAGFKMSTGIWHLIQSYQNYTSTDAGFFKTLLGRFVFFNSDQTKTTQFLSVLRMQNVKLIIELPAVNSPIGPIAIEDFVKKYDVSQ